MRKTIYTLFAMLCGAVAPALAQEFSAEIAPSFANPTVRLDCRIFSDNYANTKDFVDVLAISGDCTVYDPASKKVASMKGNISSVYVIQDAKKPDSVATVFASFDKNSKDDVLGNGGGLVYFKIKRSASDGAWKVAKVDSLSKNRDVYFVNVDFSSVKGTLKNTAFSNLGTLENTTQRFLVTEDVTAIRSNKDLQSADTSDYEYPDQVTLATQSRSVIPKGQKLKRFLSHGWPIQIDGYTGKVIGKFHRLGRGVTAITNDGSSLIFAYGGNPSVLMKYTPYTEISSIRNQDFPNGDPVKGDGYVLLTAYKQNEDGTGGFSVNVSLRLDSVPGSDPSNPDAKDVKYSQLFDSLVVAKEAAIRAGATLFANIGDIAVTKDEYGQTVYLITEKGVDNSGNAYTRHKEQLALHLKSLDSTTTPVNDGRFEDPYGRILVLNGNEGKNISVLTKGGESKGDYFFSNPDKLEVITTDPNTNATLFAVKENIPATSLGRNPAALTNDKKVNEAYYFELTTSLQGVLPLDYATSIVLPIPFENYKLYTSGSNGSLLSSNGGFFGEGVGTYLPNSKMNNGKVYDTYLTVVNGYNGTDKSRILAVRNLYPSNKCTVTSLLAEESAHNTFTVWPNPTQGKLTVDESATYTVSTLAGVAIKTFPDTRQLDLSEVEKGIYFVKRDDGSVRKVIVE